MDIKIRGLKENKTYTGSSRSIHETKLVIEKIQHYLYHWVERKEPGQRHGVVYYYGGETVGCPEERAALIYQTEGGMIVAWCQDRAPAAKTQGEQIEVK